MNKCKECDRRTKYLIDEVCETCGQIAVKEVKEMTKTKEFIAAREQQLIGWMTLSNNTYPLLDLIDFMQEGGKIAHYEWEINEYITIKDGYFVDEKGVDFTLSPLLVGEYFHKLEDLV